MTRQMPLQIRSREEAGRLLAKKLWQYEETNAMVVGIPHGGVCVASSLGNYLSLPIEVMGCRKIKHPSDGNKNIGSVSADEVIVHDACYDLPQDYISHQINLLRHSIRSEHNFYYGDNNRISLRYKIVIVVDDVLKSSDTMLACLRAIKKEQPMKIVVAVPVANAGALQSIQSEADEIIFLELTNDTNIATDHFSSFPKIDEHTVRDLLRESKMKNRRSHVLRN